MITMQANQFEQVQAKFLSHLRAQITEMPRFSSRWPIDKTQTEAMIYAAYTHRVSVARANFRDDELVKKKITLAASWICEGKSSGLFLCGGVGNGKTTLADAICDTLAYVGRIQVRKVKATEIILFGRDNIDYILDLCKTNFLMIDDIGTEAVEVNNFGNYSMPIVDIFSARYDSRKPMICTTNLTKEDFGKIYGKRVADRAKQTFAWLPFNNESFR